MSATPDSIEQIDAELAELQIKRLAILETQRSDKLGDVKLVIKQFGFTAKELGLTARDKATAVKREPRYVNPANPQQTWGGAKVHDRYG